MRLPAALAFCLAVFGTVAAQAAGCPGNPGAMGTSRVLKIDPQAYPRVGTVQYQDTLPLNDKEVVLTFDDGPLPPYTNRVLEALAHECVKANYFVVGRMARGYPQLLRRIQAEGHVIGTHSESHPLAFEKMPLAAARQEIDKGFASTAAALGGNGTVAPFFRFPGLLRADPVEGYLRSRSMVTWSADVVADDWKHITASEVVSRSLARLDSRGKGILLLHDIQPATALALPHLLRELKRRGYKIVQVMPETAAALVAAATPRQPAGEAQASVAAPAPAQPQPQSAIPPKPQPQRETSTSPTSTWPTSTSPTPARSAPPVAAPPTPAVAATRAEPAVTGTRQASASLEEIVTQIADTQAAVRTATAGPVDPADLPAGRALPVPILEASRLAPGASRASAKPGMQPMARPLTAGFKPSHSAALPVKVLERPAEPAVAKPPAPEPATDPSRPSHIQDGERQHDKEAQQQDQPAAESAAETSGDSEPRAQGDPATDRPEAGATELAPPRPERIIDVWSNRAGVTPPAAPRTPWPATAWSLRDRSR